MTDIWQGLAIGVACRIEFERQCARGGLLDESAIVRFAAEFLQARWPGDIRVCERHPDLPGAFVDLVGLTPQGKSIDLALEAKWVKDGGGTREWLKEITVDVFRLQHFTSGTAQGVSRAILVAGVRTRMKDEVWDRSVQTGAKSSITALPLVLPPNPSATASKMPIRKAEQGARRWLKACHKDLGVALPSSYDARLAGHYRTGADDRGVEAAVWLTTRPQGWGSFDPSSEWK